MKTFIRTSDLSHLIAEAKYPNGFLTQGLPIIERTYHNLSLVGKGSYRETFFEGIHVGYGDFSLDQRTRLFIESDLDTVRMHFMLRGDTQTKSQDTGAMLEMGSNQHNIFYSSGFRGYSEWSPKKNMQVFTVNLMPSFFKRYMPESIAVFERFKKHLYRGEPAQLYPHHLPITPQMLLIIGEIRNTQRKGELKKMFIEAKVIELLVSQFEQVAEHTCDTSCNLKPSDIDKMHAVKEILRRDLSTSRSLPDLAQQVGTNDYTLKRGFKEVFGTTVFGYWQEMKMHQAKKLLLDEGLTVAEISQQIGYKNPQHFSTAFKRYFGESPGRLKA